MGKAMTRIVLLSWLATWPSVARGQFDDIRRDPQFREAAAELQERWSQLGFEERFTRDELQGFAEQRMGSWLAGLPAALPPIRDLGPTMNRARYFNLGSRSLLANSPRLEIIRRRISDGSLDPSQEGSAISTLEFAAMALLVEIGSSENELGPPRHLIDDEVERNCEG